METEDQGLSRPTVEEEERRQLESHEEPVEEVAISVLSTEVQVDAPGEDASEATAAKQPAETLTLEGACRVVESLLFAASTPVTLPMLREATGFPTALLREALAALGDSFSEGTGGIVLTETAGGYQFRTAADNAAYVRRLLQIRPQRLTRAALETLALVAYRQPVTRAEVEEVRGVDCGAVIKALLERRLLKILGKKEEVGRPLIYGTSKEFLEFFGFKDLASLPTLREFQELSEEHRSVVEQETGPPPDAPRPLAELASDALDRQREATEAEGEEALDYLEAAMAEAEARAQCVGAQLVVSEEAPPPPAEERQADG
jgi:segregation and condensation protein B